MKKTLIGISIGILVLLIIFLASGLWKRFFVQGTDTRGRAVVITPGGAGLYSSTSQTRQVLWDENISTKSPMENGEIVITVMNRESEEGVAEEQFVVYYSNSGASKEIFITYISFNERSKMYTRMWNFPVAAARVETISLFSQDIIGDRNNCVIVTGMNDRNEHTMTVLRRASNTSKNFNKIAELQIDGSIVIQETPRPSAYQQGMARGQSFNIAAYSHDSASNNILDQIETIYAFNQTRGQFEIASVSKIPGSQMEQRQLREILSGVPGVFENFINDLWYYVSPNGTVDAKQYLYFDPSSREIIFYGDGAQQVFYWQNSTPTRYGLYIRSQNISISTLLRFIDIELESMDSVKLRVTEDVQLRIAINTNWDGSYRRAGTLERESNLAIRPAIDALYDSSWGRLEFNSAGEYSINSGSAVRKGHYVFYRVNNQELLEFRAENKNDAEYRMIYKVAQTGSASLSLSRIRFGVDGVHDLFEPAITLTPVQ